MTQLSKEERDRRRRAAIDAWGMRNPEKVKEAKRRWLEKNKEIRNALRREKRAIARLKRQELQRKWEAENQDLVVARSRENSAKRKRDLLANTLRFHYGLTLAEFQSMRERQHGQCAICGTSEDKNTRGYRLFVDHDHKRGVIRNLLCGTCNSAIGFLNEDVDLLMKMAKYLDAFESIPASSYRWDERCRAARSRITDD
jgi:hypothetical protein